jgi:hypothetical protein
MARERPNRRKRMIPLRIRASRFVGDRNGGVAILFSVALLAVVAAAGAALDFSRAASWRSSVLLAADAAAIAGAKEYLLHPTLSKDEQVARVERTTREALTGGMSRVMGAEHALGKIVVKPVYDDRTVEVTVAARIRTSLASIFGIRELAVSAETKAQAVVKEDPICILALDPQANPGILFQGAGELNAEKCIAWSNSRMPRSIAAQGSGRALTRRMCAAGRVQRNGPYRLVPTPEENCTSIADPMAAWTPPPVEACSETGGVPKKSTGTIVLSPGTYCGGLRVEADQIRLQQGIYVIKDGPLVLTGNARIEAKFVGIYLTGAGASMTITGNTDVDLLSPSSGPMAGVAVAQDRFAAPGQKSSITGNSDLRVGGVLYFPTQKLSYWGNSKTQAWSPVTTVVAESVEIGGSAYLEVTNDIKKNKFAPVMLTGESGVRLIR